MEKRYQIFISSTFADLIEERKAIMEAILDLNCFPTGMEMFPANDSEQFEYIKTIIDESDYYVLVIAGRYGSLADDGTSYTEKEYDYAIEKGIPVLVFVRNNIDNISVKNSESDPDQRKKLDSFRNKAMKNKLSKYWDTADQLKYAVSSSLLKIFKTNPRVGWIRGNIENNSELLIQLNRLRLDYEKLNSANNELQKQISNYNNQGISIEDLASGDDIITVTFEYGEAGADEVYKGKKDFTWNEIIKIIGIKLSEDKTDDDFKEALEEGMMRQISDKCDYFVLDDGIYYQIKVQLIALGIIKEFSGIIELSEKGLKEFINMMVIKKSR